MGSTGLPFPTSNNAPLPVPGGYGNPTGANFGAFGSTTGQPFPTFPAFGGPSYNAPVFGTGNNPMGNISSGLGFQYGKDYGSDIYNRLGTAFGKGPGQLLGNILSGGLYNPQVAAALLNAQQPGIARGEAGILGAFGDAGARFSSAAALGLGDFESQVQLNQQQTLAGLFQHAQDQEMSLLEGLLPTLHQERADEGGWLNKVLGGVEAIGGIAAAPFTGGASLMMTAQGLKQLGGGGGGGGASPMMFPGMPGWGGNTGTFGANAPSWLAGTGGNFGSGIDSSLQQWMSNGIDMSHLMGDGGDGLFSDIPGLTGN